MINSATLQIADQIAADMASCGLTPPFTPLRKFVPRTQLKGLVNRGTYLMIAPSGRQGKRATRGARVYTHSVDIGLLAKIGTEEGTEQEQLDRLMEDLGDWYFERPLGGSREETLDTVTSQFLFDPALLAEDKIFLSVSTLNFLGYRENAAA